MPDKKTNLATKQARAKVYLINLFEGATGQTLRRKMELLCELAKSSKNITIVNFAGRWCGSRFDYTGALDDAIQLCSEEEWCDLLLG